jgi:uncharacterized repeat protein (TIGR01451 family)
MLREIFLIGLVSTTVLFAMGGPVPNYDEKFNESINQRIKETMPIIEEVVPVVKVEEHSSDTTNIRLKSLVFQEVNHRNIPVTEVKSGSKVVYINVAINDSSNIKKDIVIRNPIPRGTEYVRGSATCDNRCIISYSSSFGDALSLSEDDNVNYIEYYFKRMDLGKEYRMGFRAVVK